MNDEAPPPPHEGPKKWSRAAEEKLRRQFLRDVRDKCKDEVSAFAACSKDAGFAVVWKCGVAKRVANDCVKQYSADELYDEYRREKKGEWIRQGLLLPQPGEEDLARGSRSKPHA